LEKDHNAVKIFLRDTVSPHQSWQHPVHNDWKMIVLELNDLAEGNVSA
jgi:hypothetical protein